MSGVNHSVKDNRSSASCRIDPTEGLQKFRLDLTTGPMQGRTSRPRRPFDKADSRPEFTDFNTVRTFGGGPGSVYQERVVPSSKEVSVDLLERGQVMLLQSRSLAHKVRLVSGRV